MKLTDRQKLLLAAVENDAEIPLARLSRTCKMQERTVRDSIQRLIQADVIYPMHLIDVSRLGLLYFDVFFSIALRRDSLRQELLSFLTESDRVALLLELGGDYDYGMAICARQVHEVLEFLETLGSRFGDVFAEKAVVTRSSYTGFGRKYLTNRAVRPVIRLGAASDCVRIDEIDHAILRLLSRERTRSHAALARRLGLSVTTFRYRLEQLRAKQVLKGPIYAVTPWRYGYQSFRVLLSTKGLSPAFHEKLYEVCARHMQVVSMVTTLGSWDYELTIELEDATAMPVVVQELKYALGPWLAHTRTLPVFKYLKGSSYPFENKP